MATTNGEFYRGLEAATAALAVDGHAAARAAAVHGAIGPLLRDTPAAGQLACRSGCAHCCRFPVGVTFGEAARVAAAVADDGGLRSRLLADADAADAHEWAELVGRPCPLLIDDACARYDARPLPCRALASRDADACARSLTAGTDVPRDEHAWWRGLGATAALAGDDVEGTRELRSAVAALLRAPAAEHAAAFLGARAAPGSTSSAHDQK